MNLLLPVTLTDDGLYTIGNVRAIMRGAESVFTAARLLHPNCSGVRDAHRW